MEIVEKDHFKKILSQPGVIVLVDFYGDGCAPCRQIIPLLDWAEKTYSKLRVHKVNAGEVRSISDDFNIRAIPTLILFHQGKEIDRVVGAVAKITLIKSIDNALNKLEE